VTSKKTQKIKRRVATGVMINFSEEAWAALLTYFGGHCAYCGRAMDLPTKDHITPLSRGGAHTEDNIIPACGSCNAKKNDRNLLEWLLAQSTRINPAQA
jgi:5-methylcytosine-specific restriction endonuclease McrA